MNPLTLTPEQQQEIEDRLAHLSADAPLWLRRRLQAVLLYGRGLATSQVAAETGLSRGRTRFWRRQFTRRGMDIFSAPTPHPASANTPPYHPIVPGDEALPGPAAAPSRPSSAIAIKEAGPTHPSGPPYPAPMDRAGITPDDFMAEAGRKIMLFQFAEMLSHEAGTRLGADIEELHHMRVATRRLRAALDIFSEFLKPKVVRPHLKGLRAAGRALGRVRDLDVFIQKAQQFLASLPPEQRSGLDPLVSAWEEQRAAARIEMLNHLDSPAYDQFKWKFNLFLQTPGKGALPERSGASPPGRVREAAPVLIFTRLGAVRAYAPLLDHASLEQLHALRIEFKKLRYAVEFFREVLGEEAKPVIATLKQVQDHLGDLNDARVACGLLSDFLTNWENRQISLPLGERQSPAGIAAYLAEKHAELHRLTVAFPETWQRFDQAGFRRNLALAVAAL